MQGLSNFNFCNNHSACKDVINHLLTANIDINLVFPLLLTKLGQVRSYNGRYNASCRSEFCLNQKENIKSIIHLLTKYPSTLITDDIVDMLLRYQVDDVIKHLQSKITFTQDHLIHACEHSNIACIKILFDNKILPTSEAFVRFRINTLFTGENNSYELLKIFIDFGLQINKEISEHICQHYNLDSVNLLLNTCIIQECNYVKNLVQSTYLSRKLIAGVIDKLFSNGYILSYDNLLCATRHGVTINDIEKYNFTFDDRLIDACVYANMNPYRLKASVKMLECLCKYQRIAKIKTLIISGVKPNIVCLQNACALSNNNEAVDLILKTGVVADETCVRAICGHTNAGIQIAKSYFEAIAKQNGKAKKNEN